MRTEYLKKLITERHLLREEVLLIDSTKVNVQRAVASGYLAIQVGGQNGFELATMEAVEIFTDYPDLMALARGMEQRPSPDHFTWSTAVKPHLQRATSEMVGEPVWEAESAKKLRDTI